MRSRVVSLSLLLASFAPAAWAQEHAGPEFRVNIYTTGAQARPAIAARRDGSWMVTWETVGEDGSGSGVIAKHYDRFGVLHGEEFVCNTFTTGFQGAPSISASAKAAVVTWHSLGQDGSGSGVYAQRLDGTHQTVGAEFRVNTFTPNYQYGPSLSSAPNGTFVVAWSSYFQDGASYAVVARRYDAAGVAQGAEILVNTYTTGPQANPSVATAASGDFVVVWDGGANQDGARSGIFGQLFKASGARVGAEFRVNTYTGNDQMLPAAAMTDDGNFIVAWQSMGQDGAGFGVFAQRFDALATRRGAEFQVNVYTTNDQTVPSAGIDADGNFVVAFRSFTQDGDQGSVSARRFSKDGIARSIQFRANTTVNGDQSQPALAVDRVGNFSVLWTSLSQDGSDAGVYGQRFGGLLPAPPVSTFPPVLVDPTGNGVFEPGETVAVQPAWENVSGAGQSFTGSLSDFTGPPGGTYIIVDGNANYGAVPANLVQRCSTPNNCYVLTVTAPTTRPVLHWDSTVLETLAPVDQGQVKRWTLHLGDSFADVPRTSGFYRFVEALLHHSITSGCGGNSYCPGSSTSRQAMAVFALVAKEGAGYTPAACTTPVFADVPANSGFCPYIEEMYRRGIVGGCATNPLSFCPASDVTREQMAVFLLRTLDPALNPVACTSKPYDDVEVTSPFCRWITELVARGITSGCGGGNFCPKAPVTREQMSAFLSVTFSLLLYGG